MEVSDYFFFVSVITAVVVVGPKIIETLIKTDVRKTEKEYLPNNCAFCMESSVRKICPGCKISLNIPLGEENA